MHAKRYTAWMLYGCCMEERDYNAMHVFHGEIMYIATYTCILLNIDIYM